MAQRVDKSKESLFLEALNSIEKGGYLGDAKTVSLLLRIVAFEFFDTLPKLDSSSQLESLIRSLGRKYMRIFLGSSKKYRPVRNWNMPGAVDKFVADWCGIDEDKPTERLTGVLASMLDELGDLELMARDPAVEQGQWDWQVSAVITKYTMLFLGISPPLQWSS